MAIVVTAVITAVSRVMKIIATAPARTITVPNVIAIIAVSRNAARLENVVATPATEGWIGDAAKDFTIGGGVAGKMQAANVLS